MLTIRFKSMQESMANSSSMSCLFVMLTEKTDTTCFIDNLVPISKGY